MSSMRFLVKRRRSHWVCWNVVRKCCPDQLTSFAVLLSTLAASIICALYKWSIGNCTGLLSRTLCWQYHTVRTTLWHSPAEWDHEGDISTWIKSNGLEMKRSWRFEQKEKGQKGRADPDNHRWNGIRQAELCQVLGCPHRQGSYMEDTCS